MTTRILATMMILGGLLLICMGAFNLIEAAKRHPAPTPTPMVSNVQLPTR